MRRWKLWDLSDWTIESRLMSDMRLAVQADAGHKGVHPWLSRAVPIGVIEWVFKTRWWAGPVERRGLCKKCFLTEKKNSHEGQTWSMLDLVGPWGREWNGCLRWWLWDLRSSWWGISSSSCVMVRAVGHVCFQKGRNWTVSDQVGVGRYFSGSSAPSLMWWRPRSAPEFFSRQELTSGEWVPWQEDWVLEKGSFRRARLDP